MTRKNSLQSKTKRAFVFIAAVFAVLFLLGGINGAANLATRAAFADTATEIPSENNEETWTRYVDMIGDKLAGALNAYKAQEYETAAALTETIHSEYFQNSGFRAMIAGNISEARASVIDGKFADVKSALAGRESDAAVSNKIGLLKTEL
jgi:hypothetical protein